MGLATLTPTDAPSVPAWKWYEYAQQAPSKFLADFVKRKDAKAKTGDALTDKLVEDDKRMQYGLIERVITVAARQAVEARSAIDGVVTTAAEERVVATAAIERHSEADRASVKLIVAAIPIEREAAGEA